jgi:tetratricopeptide (TPR) repeat protein
MRRSSSVCIFALLAVHLRAEQPVRAWEAKLTLPTYEIGAPDPNPLFDTGRVYQRAHAPIYPYFILDRLTGKKAPKSYDAVYLENEYVKICVLPELGGRLFSAVDKTNGYDFIYRQTVIKPGLVGMLGAWISGGIEWDLPHHHRATTYMRVSHRIEAQPNGGQTVWVGEIELRHRMKWLIGMTLRQGSSAVEITGRLINRTPVANSFLHFANIAVHANPEYQVIFPPGTEYATNHHKKEFSRWPVSDNVYNNIDFRKGIDVSLWKNHPSPISMFAWGGKGDFVAGYDHGKQAGTVHVGSRHNASGMKFFTWGAGTEGKMWDHQLTDADGPYVELMAGAYSDNQPDYAWIQPYETKTFRGYLYPVQRIGSVKAANGAAALNLEVDQARHSIRLRLLTTSAHPKAAILLRAKSSVLLREAVAVGPGRPIAKDIALPAGVAETDLEVTVSSDGKELIRYRPPVPVKAPWPEVVTPPPPAEKIASVEELYLAAQRMEQFHTAGVDPETYYREALRRDPNDTRVNTALGVRLYRKGSYRDAEELLRTALQRSTHNYTTPKDGETWYYLGLALRAEQKLEAARDAFDRAAWSGAWQAAACFQLAEMAAHAGEPGSALEFLDRSLAANPLNIEAHNLRAILARGGGNRIGPVRETLAIDPLDRWAAGDIASSRAESARDPNPAFETALRQLRAGFPAAAAATLSQLAPEKATNPLWHYYLGYASLQSGDTAGADAAFRAAAATPADYCAPFRPEEEGILRAALERNPKDWLALYLLGNTLFDRQPEPAIEAWERSRALHDQFAPVHRNLALGYWRVRKDYGKAAAAMECAIARNPREPRYLLELDQIQEAARIAPAQRLRMMEKRADVVAMRDDALTRMLSLMLIDRQYDRALEVMEKRSFHMWEGIGKFGIHEPFVDAHLGRGQEHLKAGRHREALADFQAALAYPANLGTPQPLRGARYPEIHYWIGAAWEALGDHAKAKQAYAQAVEKGPVLLSAPRPAAIDQPQVFYCLALALRRIGQTADADRLLEMLLAAGLGQLEDKVQLDFFTPYGEPDPLNVRLGQAHYAIALASQGLGNPGRAAAEFDAALRLRPDIVSAARYLPRRPVTKSE